MENETLAFLADRLLAAKEAKEEAQRQEKEANVQIAKLEEQIHQAMVASEIERFGHNGHLFYPYIESHPAINKQREEDAFCWLEEHGEAGIIKKTIHPQTLKGWWKQNSEQYAEELTEKGLISAFERIRIGVRKA